MVEPDSADTVLSAKVTPCPVFHATTGLHQTRKTLAETAQGSLVEGVAGALPLRPAGHETGIHQYLEMLRYGGLGHGDAAHDILAAAALIGIEVPQDRYADGMGERCQLARDGAVVKCLASRSG